ncbi:hypothetical protein [Bifidobacterium sp. CP2]|uniref:hypothetical protein n=1 Tax=Bifidobacterium sp. CP2 TaxID=2809025 RepID=UPI001F0AADFA|nr:hypothetical protein [Bifidobacterium sp. CP2]
MSRWEYVEMGVNLRNDARRGACRALAAMALVAAMVAAPCAFAVLTRTASAATIDGLPAGALCTPTEQSMGTDVDISKDRDPGVATWVGGNMYIGRKPTDSASWKNGTGPDGSYAVEAEGLTVVNGKLMMKPLKNSWAGAGFRFGIVGFGT